MKEERVSFVSDGLKLAGILRTPDDLAPGEKRPAFLVLHGFGGNKDTGTAHAPARWLCERGYVTLAFDFRGCGDSEGRKGWIICLEQVEDTKNALSWMQERPEVDPARIGLIGNSFGAAVAVYTAGVDKRVAAAISCGGWGDGARKFRGQHPTPEAWKRFTDMLAEGKRRRGEGGETLMVSRWDIVPIPEHLRANLSSRAIMEFPSETAQSMMDFIADDVVGDIAPRPLLLLHSASDSVTPTEQSIEMFKRARQPADLHLLADLDHFMFAEANTRVYTVLADWLEKYFPAKAAVAA